MTSSAEDCTNWAIESEFVQISTASPRKAIARRKPQKKSVPMMIARNTPTAVA